MADAADGVVCIKLDGDKEKELVKQYKVEGYPTLIMLDADGKEVGRLVGYKGVKEMTAALKKLKKLTTWWGDRAGRPAASVDDLV